MFLKDTTRFKDGKEHHYWSLVENRRVDGGHKVVQRHVLYLGEINFRVSVCCKWLSLLRDFAEV